MRRRLPSGGGGDAATAILVPFSMFFPHTRGRPHLRSSSYSTPRSPSSSTPRGLGGASPIDDRLIYQARVNVEARPQALKREQNSRRALVPRVVIFWGRHHLFRHPSSRCILRTAFELEALRNGELERVVEVAERTRE